jgi:hypothetical protein
LQENGFKHKTAAWTSVSTATDENNKTTTSEGKVWLSGNKYRMEAKDQKGKLNVFIQDGTDTFMVVPGEKKALRWGPGADKMFSGILSGDVVAESAKQRKQAKKIGSETLDGKLCAIYAYTSTVTVMENTVSSDVKEWNWTSEVFPIKSVVKTPKHKMKISFMTMDVPASETVTLIKDLVLDKPIDESLFQVPAGYKIETLDMPDSGQGNAPAAGGEESQPAKSGKASSASEGGSSDDQGEAKEKPAVDVNKLLKGLY